MEYDNTLKHYGVLGMKWGVRRTDAQLARARGGKSSGSSKNVFTAFKKKFDEKKEREAKMKAMSDDELRRRVQRLEMEKRYSQLTTKEKSRGQKVVEDILANTARSVGTKYATQYAIKGIDALISKYGSK